MQSKRRAQDVIEKLARAGYATKGALYCTLGALSVQAARSGGSATGNEGAMRTIAEQPFGAVLLALMTIGLLGYAAWRLIQAAYDAEHEGGGRKAQSRALALRVAEPHTSRWQSFLSRCSRARLEAMPNKPTWASSCLSPEANSSWVLSAQR